jgi:hypothetical protein
MPENASNSEEAKKAGEASDQLSGLSKKKYAALRDAMFREMFLQEPRPGTPRAVFTGGLSGLGKTTLVEAMLRPMTDGVIDANDLRNYHPRYAEYINEYGSEMARDLTRDFCDKLAVDLQDEALAEGRSFVREGTLQLPSSCIPEALNAAELGHAVWIVVLVAQAGDEALGRHMRHWEMQGDKERLAVTKPGEARAAYVREIEHTYDDTRAQTGILLTLARVEEGLRRHAEKTKGISAHRILVLGTDGSVKYACNFFGASSESIPAWQVYALEYDRRRTNAEAESLAARLRRTRALMHNFVATDKEWFTFQRLVEDRLALQLPAAETARPQRDLARQDKLTSRFDPASVWTPEKTAELKKLLGA